MRLLPAPRPLSGALSARAASLLAASIAVGLAAPASARTSDVAPAPASPAAPSVQGRPTLLDEPPRLFTFKLDDPSSPNLSLLRAFQNAEVERPGPMRRYLGGLWGRWGAEPWRTLSWSAQNDEVVATQSREDGGAEIRERSLLDLGRAAALASWTKSGERLFGFEAKTPDARLRIAPDASMSWLRSLDPEWTPPALVSTGQSFASNGFDALWAAPARPIADWRCRRRPVTFMRYGGETAAIELVRCDGSVAPDAIDKLSIMARPPDAKSPGPDQLLPDEPEERAWEQREWLPKIRVVNPRLLWALQRIADAFPWRSIYIYSGYRPRAQKGGSHHSLHSEARAMDISVSGVPNATLLELCRKLDDVGCGFYPNSKFVHVDVRHPGTGHAFWIDASGPGEPSRYVDSWPGVVLSGGMAWDGRRMAEQEAEQQQLEGGVPSSSVCSNGPRGNRQGQ